MKINEVAVVKNADQKDTIAAQELKKTIGFPLHKLPIVAFFEVIRIMTIMQRVKLALSSPEMEMLLQIARPKPGTVILDLNGEESKVIVYFKTELFCGETQTQMKRNRDVRKLDLAPWLDPKLSTHENTINVYRRILKIFPTNFFKLAIHLTDSNQSIIREMLAVPDFQNFKEIMIFGKKIDKENLDLVMETFEEDRSIVLEVKDMSDGYFHENMFKFIAVDYNASRWIKVEHLFSMRNVSDVKLRRSSFTVTDINMFLKFWANCDHDMFKRMHVSFDKPTRVPREIMFEGVVALISYRNGDPFFLVASEPHTTRMFRMMSIFYRRDLLGIRFTCRLIDQPFPHNRRPAESFRREFEILEVLSQKKFLEDRLKVLLDPIEQRGIEQQLRRLGNDLKKRGVQLDGLLPEVLPVQS